eukprot:11182735-Lingulodinium_polyedra.AAC.1
MMRQSALWIVVLRNMVCGHGGGEVWHRKVVEGSGQYWRVGGPTDALYQGLYPGVCDGLGE